MLPLLEPIAPTPILESGSIVALASITLKNAENRWIINIINKIIIIGWKIIDLDSMFLLEETYNNKIKTLKPKVLIGKNISEVLKSNNNGKKDMKIKIKK